MPRKYIYFLKEQEEMVNVDDKECHWRNSFAK